MITHVQASSAYSAARNAIAPSDQADGVKGRMPDISAMGDEFAQVMAQADTAATGAMTGTAETHQLVQSLAEAEVALQTVVAIRDKVVEAYQEILRMPV